MRSRLLLPLLGSMIAIGVLFVGIFPTRALLDQRSELARQQERLEFVAQRNAELEARVEALGTDAEIERIAREQYNLVYPGEEAYAILPAPPAPPAIPDAWPFRELRSAVMADSSP
jgi:cell division protein FtsB